ncbi:MAG: hypothetical protein BWY88_00131 [Synergistetes bacterium ADurb.Bin520]|nr:MAG: hypothetical protein BWY88_00131 [Synergistetes bacterium ADurb.Bin520]
MGPHGPDHLVQGLGLDAGLALLPLRPALFGEVLPQAQDAGDPPLVVSQHGVVPPNPTPAPPVAEKGPLVVGGDEPPAQPQTEAFPRHGIIGGSQVVEPVFPPHRSQVPPGHVKQEGVAKDHPALRVELQGVETHAFHRLPKGSPLPGRERGGPPRGRWRPLREGNEDVMAKAHGPFPGSSFGSRGLGKAPEKEILGRSSTGQGSFSQPMAPPRGL